MAIAWKPSLSELQAVHAAAARTVNETPVFSVGDLSKRCGGRVAIKAENLQRTGSFKLRGALAKLAALDRADLAGVVAGSAGNHGQSLAYAARERRLPCTVFMPEAAPVSKVDAVHAYGAKVRQEHGSVEDCVAAAGQLAEREGLAFVHPFDDLDVIAGQAGVGIELARQVPDLARVLVPVGGGGLIGGIAAALSLLRPQVRVVGVQAAGCAPFPSSLQRQEPVAVAAGSTLADGIAIKRPSELTLSLAERWVAEVVTVEDAAIAEAMVMLIERAKLVAEGAGAAAVAALASGAVSPSPTGTTVAVISGGNVDAQLLAEIVARHQSGIGRRRRLFTTISDRPGGLAQLLGVVASAGGNVLEVVHVRDRRGLGVDQTGVELVVETRGNDHGERLVGSLREDGYGVSELR